MNSYCLNSYYLSVDDFDLTIISFHVIKNSFNDYSIKITDFISTKAAEKGLVALRSVSSEDYAALVCRREKRIEDNYDVCVITLMKNNKTLCKRQIVARNIIEGAEQVLYEYLVDDIID